jgi:hypothetical protein
MMENMSAEQFRNQFCDGVAAKKQPAAKATARPKPQPKGMNKTEAKMDELLRGMMLAGEVQWYGFEAVTFKLADDCRFTPDFIVIYADGSIEARETKGFWRDDAKVKIKVAAAKFHWLTFAAFRLVKGQWEREQF